MDNKKGQNNSMKPFSNDLLFLFFSLVVWVDFRWDSIYGPGVLMSLK